MSISRWMAKKAVVHIHNGVLHTIKKNTFESVLMRWMKLEPIIQSEASQKEKHQYNISFSSVRFSRSVVSDSMPPHELQHARPPCPSPTPGVHSNSCPSSQWCHPAISSSVVPFSSCPQTLPASESFPMSQLYSAIKKNTFESVLMRWMKLEPIIQSEVSQKEKHQYSILTHIYVI